MTIIPIAILVAQSSIIVTLATPSSMANQGVEHYWRLWVSNTGSQTKRGILDGNITIQPQNELVFQAQTDSVDILPGTTRLFTYRTVTVASSWAAPNYHQLIAQTGGLPPVPEGQSYKFEVCFRTQDTNTCNSVPFVIPDVGQLRLTSPDNGSTINVSQRNFTWTYEPTQAGVTFEIKIVKVLSGQPPEQAMLANQIFYHKSDINVRNLTLPLSARLDKGQKYGWEVIARSGSTEIATSPVFAFSVEVEDKLNLPTFDPACTGNTGEYTFTMLVQNPSSNTTSFTGFSFANPFGTIFTGSVMVTITQVVNYPARLPAATNIPITNQPPTSYQDLSSCNIQLATNATVTVKGKLKFLNADSNPQPITGIQVWLRNQTGTSPATFDSTNVPFIVCGYNCCKNFIKKVDNLTVTQSSAGKYTLSGLLTAGPHPICKIQARIVNFSYLPVSIPPASNCPNCVWPSTKFGNFGPPVSIGSLTPPATLTTTSPFNYSREFIWQGTPFNVSSTPFGVSLLLPDASPLGACCQDTIKMSIRFLFTDTLCNTCDTVISFWFTRNPSLGPTHIVYNEDFDNNSNAGYGFNSQKPNPNRGAANRNSPNPLGRATLILPTSTLNPDSSYSSMQTELAPDKIRLNEAGLSCYPTNNLSVPKRHNKNRPGNTCCLLATLIPLSICRRKRRSPMKNIKKYIFVVLFFVFAASAAATDCCPKFSLVADFQPCDSCESTDTNLSACKNITHTYTVYPNLTGYTFTWMIFGGTSTSYTSNPMAITWGSSSQGFIQVIISNADGSCRDAITKRVCLIDGPTASFSFSPNSPVCKGSAVHFTDHSVGGSRYYWDFGDGSFSTDQNPTHSYTAQGTYTVVFTVSVSTGSERDSCQCRDVKSAEITVSPKTGIDIYADDCRKMFCAGDMVRYCTSTSGCTNLNWVVNGGRIISGQGTTCISVVWDQPSTYPTTVTLTADCPNTTCGNSATLFVPVLYPTLLIQGPNPVCFGSISTYSLPALPGTFYHWKVIGDGYIMAADSNINFINVNATASGSFTITCNYNNPYSGCGGSSTLDVIIKPKFAIVGPLTVCTGDNAYYNVVNMGINDLNAGWTVTTATGAPATGWTFVTSSGTLTDQAISFTWATDGIYCITATPTTSNSYCPPQSATIIVTVNPTPVLTFIDDPDAVICPGQLYNYSVRSNVSGGNFTWNLSGTGGTVWHYGENNSSASIIFDGTGTYPWTLQVTQTVNGCSGSTTLSITKEPAPTLPTGPIQTCIGAQITVSVTSGTGPFTWSTSPGASLIIGQGTGTATYEIHSSGSITVSNCSGGSTINVTTTAPPAISITPSGSLCLGNLQLYADVPPGSCTSPSYQWSGGVIVNPQTISVTDTGTYVVQVTCFNGCKSVKSYTVAPQSVPTVTISTGDPLKWCLPATPLVNLHALTSGSSSCIYQWYKNNSSNPVGGNNGHYPATSAGSYFVKVTCPSGCIAISDTITVVQESCQGPVCSSNPLSDITVSSDCNPKTFSVTVTGCPGSTVNWDFGDGGTATSLPGLPVQHTYTNPGAYHVVASIICNRIMCSVYKSIDIPLKADFNYSVVCSTGNRIITLTNISQILDGWSLYALPSWTSNCGTPLTGTGNTYILTVPSGCNPIVTLNIMVKKIANPQLTCDDSITFTFNFATPILSIIGGPTVCKNQTSQFSSSIPGILYEWTVSGIPVSQNPELNYAFDGSLLHPVVGLTVTDAFGCPLTISDTLTVVTPRALTIEQGPLVEICPDCLPPFIINTAPPRFTEHQWYRNGVAIEGATDSAYQLCNFNASGNYYVTAYDAKNNDCVATSNTIQVVYQPKPIANIQGQSIQCGSGNAPYNIELQSPNISGYAYNWECEDLDLHMPLGVEFFDPNNTTDHVKFMAPDKHHYQFILTVTDNNGCMAKDTFCVIVYSSPTVDIDAPSNMCEGTMYTLTATPYNPNYIYHWNNGATGKEIKTGQVGEYFVTVIDPISGCSNNSTSVVIKKRPYVDLFPLGCDTMCDTDTLIPPLPLKAPPQIYDNIYDIKWYEDVQLITTGSKLIPTLTGLSSGWHHIYIVVADKITGCISISGTYDVFVQSCCCKNSHWGKMSYSAALQKHIMNCDGSYVLKCNRPYTINASYICLECPSKVTYAITDQIGNTTTGNVPFTFTPTLGDNYLMTLYGWCGDSLCDSCKITFKTDCPPPQGKCQHCCDNVGINIQSQVAHYGSDWWGWYVKSNLTTTPNPIIEIRAELVNFYMNNKTGCERCVTENAYLGSILDIGAQSKINWPPLMSPAPRSYSSASPRDLVWNRIDNGLYQQRPALTNEDVTFRIVFPPPHIFQNSCCFDTIWFCIRWSFTDVNCKTCDTLICYKFIQQYNTGGGNEPQPDTLPAGRRQSMLNILPSPENQLLYTQGQNGFKPDNFDLVNHYEVIETKPVKGCSCGKK